jgi:hypothetical protein
VRELLAQLTGKPVDESVTVFPPFYSDFGKTSPSGNGFSSILGEDQGGVVIGDDCLIGRHGAGPGLPPHRR